MAMRASQSRQRERSGLALPRGFNEDDDGDGARAGRTDAGWAAFVKFFLDGTFVTKDPRMVWLVPAALIGLFILRGIGEYLQTFCPGFVGRKIVKNGCFVDVKAGFDAATLGAAGLAVWRL